MRDIPSRYNVGADLIDRNLRAGRGDRPAIWFEGKTLSYRDVAALVDRVAAAFLRAGVQPERRVLLVLPDSPELAAAYLAAMKIGAVAVPCNTLLRPADYAYFADESRASLVVTARSVLERVEPALAGVKLALVAGLGADRGPLRDLDRFLGETQHASVEAAPTHGDEPAFWLWTSGSTGKPKAAVHAHQDWPHCCEAYAGAVVGLRADDRNYSASKLFHAYGLGNSLAFPFWVGAATILRAERPTPDLVYQTIAEARPTIFYGVPTLYAAMLQAKDEPEMKSLRLCVSAGESLPGDLFRRWKERFGTEILDGIGSTEVLHIYVSTRAGSAKPGSTGEPVEGYQVRIADEQGRDVPRGETGDLLVRGPSTALYYWNRREQTRQKMRGEWFVSGDKFRQSEDGEYHYVGRSDDMFKVGGEWVSPVEVEAALVAHPAVLEAAVVAQERGGLLRCAAHVVLVAGRASEPKLADELREHVRGRCAGYMVPKDVVFVTELPKTATGKIQRYLLREAP